MTPKLIAMALQLAVVLALVALGRVDEVLIHFGMEVVLFAILRYTKRD
jgi:hypothetical protein